VSDIVAMLEQWELANFKPEYQFVDRQYAIGKAHSVSVLWRGGEVDAILEKEADVLQWMMRCSGIRRSRKAGCLKISRARIRGRSRVFFAKSCNCFLVTFVSEQAFSRCSCESGEKSKSPVFTADSRALSQALTWGGIGVLAL
jgi:hypothetical protein